MDGKVSGKPATESNIITYYLFDLATKSKTMQKNNDISSNNNSLKYTFLFKFQENAFFQTPDRFIRKNICLPVQRS